jgi:hypothetical protein
MIGPARVLIHAEPNCCPHRQARTTLVKITRRRRARQARRPSSRQRPRPSASKPRDEVLAPPRVEDGDTIPAPDVTATVTLAPAVFVDPDIFHVPGVYRLPGSKSRYGQRERWGPIQYAMRAIIVLYGGLPPEHFNASKLTRDVGEYLAKDPEYRAARFAKPKRPTVLRAVEKLRRENAPNN